MGHSASSTIANILKEEVPPVARRNPLAPLELERILQKCLRKRREERYTSASDLAVDLAALRRTLERGNRGASILAHDPVPGIRPNKLGYLAMYTIALYKFHDVLRVSHELYASVALGGILLMDAVVGVPVRLYLLSAVAFDYADLGRKFRWLFPAVLLLDAAWGAVPLLFLGQLQGAVLLCTAGLAYLPFCQRILLYTAYGYKGGRSSAFQTPKTY